MSTHFKIFLGITVALALALVIVGASVLGSALIRVSNPEDVTELVLPPPPLIPPGGEMYAEQTSTVGITSPDGRPVAYLRHVEPELAQTVSVFFSEADSYTGPEVAYTILATVRYEGNGHIVLVSTARPSAAAAEQGAPLGNRTIHLPDGSTAWESTGMQMEEIPNQVVFLRDNLIITIASDLSVETIRDLVTDVHITD